jgi:hypothetical protein
VPTSLLSRLRAALADPYLWLVLAFSLFAVLPLAGPDYFLDAHDAPHTLFFLTEFDAALRDGVWYPGWATDQALGYGYPTFVFYPPLAYYLAEGIHLLGAAKVVAIKWTWALATLGAGLAMYLFGRHVAGRRRGFLASIIYVYIPYHLVDIYVRADLAEYFSFVWMPLALLAFHRLAEGPTARRLGLAIAAALLLPGFLERQFINQTQWVRAGYNYADHFVRPAQLLSAAWGYAPGPPGTQGGASYQLGAVALILSVVAIMAAIRRPRGERAIILFFAAAALLLILLVLPVSAPAWELVPLAALIQFPWRLLALTAICLSVLSAFSTAGHRSPGPRPDAPTLVLGLVAILASFPYTLPQYTPLPESAESPLLSIEFELDYEDMRGMTAWSEEMPPSSPLVEQYLAGESLTTAQVLAPDASLEMIRAGGASDEVRVQAPNGTTVLFYTYYFPGWRVYVDGQRVPESEMQIVPPYGLLAVDVPPGEHHVLLRWGDTPLRLAGKVTTLAGLALALFLVALPRRRT